MTAFISATRRSGILQSGGEFFSFSLRKPGIFDVLPSEEAKQVIDGFDDLEVIENIDEFSAFKALHFACRQYQTLYLALFTLDSEMERDQRIDSAKALSPSLSESKELRDYLEKVLCAQKMPESADIEGAIRICRVADSIPLANILTGVRNLESNIEQVRKAWDRIPDESFGGSGARQEFQANAVRRGDFLKIVKRNSQKFRHLNTEKFERQGGIFQEWIGLLADQSINEDRTFTPLSKFGYLTPTTDTNSNAEQPPHMPTETGVVQVYEDPFKS